MSVGIAPTGDEYHISILLLPACYVVWLAT
jgi:hypothetical protein